MAAFAIGTTVRLKSGGPLMTVESGVDNMGTQICIWFTGETRQHAKFHPDTLQQDKGDDMPAMA
jgi:uncharacterized protein YodC (DUF2158 family)